MQNESWFLTAPIASKSCALLVLTILAGCSQREDRNPALTPSKSIADIQSTRKRAHSELILLKEETAKKLKSAKSSAEQERLTLSANRA